MATTEDRLTEELEEIYRSPAARPAESGEEREAPDTPTEKMVAAKDARRLFFTWAAVIGVIFLFEPRPDNPAAAVPVWAEFAAVGFLTALFATVFGLGNRRPWALSASFAAVGFGAVLAI